MFTSVGLDDFIRDSRGDAHTCAQLALVNMAAMLLDELPADSADML